MEDLVYVAICCFHLFFVFYMILLLALGCPFPPASVLSRQSNLERIVTRPTMQMPILP